MNREQMGRFKAMMRIPDGHEWDRFAGLDIPADELQRFLDQVPFARQYPRRHETAPVAVPPSLAAPREAQASTQEGFGRILNEIARGQSELARRIVTLSPDVTVSTNLGPWVNRRGVFSRVRQEDVFKEEDVVSSQRWLQSPEGQHIELGIAENNLFILLSALGLSGPLFGVRLLPIGTLYDPFIMRGLDAFNYALYQDARFMLVATPSGLTLAPEGGAHQSIATPLIGLGLPNLDFFEPAYVDELAEIMRWGFEFMQAPDGRSLYLRLSTRALAQPARIIGPELQGALIAGAYWMVPPAPDAELAIVYSGAVAPRPRRPIASCSRMFQGQGCSPSPLRAGCMSTGSRAGNAATFGVSSPSSRRTACSSRWSMGMRRRYLGWVPLVITPCIRSASSISASQAIFQTSTAPTGSTRTPFLTPAAAALVERRGRQPTGSS